jgi:hypothetical protein
MTDITTRLRSIYVAEGANYVQEAADLIECLRAERKALVNDVHSCGPTCQKAGCVNRRLRDALREYIAAADNSVRSSDPLGAMLRFGEADKAARAALGETK